MWEGIGMRNNGKLYNEIIAYDTTTGERIIKVEFDVETALKRSGSPNTWAHEVVKSIFENEMSNPSELENIAKNVLEDISSKEIPKNEENHEHIIQEELKEINQKENFVNLRKRTGRIPIRRVKKVKSIKQFQ